MVLRQNARANMFFTVDDVLSNSSAITATLPGFDEIYQAFSNGVETIVQLSGQDVGTGPGITQKRGRLKEKLVVKAFDYSSKLSAFAKLADNQPLYTDIYFTESDLRYVSNGDLRGHALKIHNKATEYLSELSPYHINEEGLAELMSLINDFAATFSKSRVATLLGKETRNKIKEEFHVCDKALKKLDALVGIVKLDEPEFYKRYIAARKIILIGRNSYSLIGKITDALTGEPLINADILITFKQNGSVNQRLSAEPIQKKSARKGGFIIKSLENGDYLVSVSRSGYVTKEATASITNGVLVRLNVALEKTKE